MAQAAKPDVTTTYSFRAGFHGTSVAAFSLTQLSCPHCEHSETLNRHSILYGNDPFAWAQQRVRGQRVFCSNRGRRGGCGKTFSIFLADMLPRHTLTATLLWQWLIQRLAGLSAKAAAEKACLPFALETMYHLGRRLKLGLDRLRTLLCRKQAPAASAQADPVLQSVEHLQKRLFTPRVSAGRVPTRFSASFPGLNHLPSFHWLPNYGVMVRQPPALAPPTTPQCAPRPCCPCRSVAAMNEKTAASHRPERRAGAESNKV